MKKTLTLILILVFTIGKTQESNFNRKAFTLKLVEESGKLYNQNIPESPYFIEDKVLEIYPGEKLFVEVEVEKDSILSMTVVDRILNPKKTIILDCFQDKSKGQTRLHIANPFRRKKLDYSAEILLLKRNQWIVPDVWTVPPKQTVYEIWSNTISCIRLKDWKLI